MISQEELNRIAAKMMQNQNNKALANFEGYSPTEMHLIINFLFAHNCPVQHKSMKSVDYSKIPIFNQLKYLEKIIGEEGGVKLTNRGYCWRCAVLSEKRVSCGAAG
jgi:hypothetical protein